MQCIGQLTLFALGVNGNSSGAEEFSLSRMLTSKGFRKPMRLARGVDWSTADIRAALALRLTTEGLMLRRSVKLAALLGLGAVPVLLALGPVGHDCGMSVSSRKHRCKRQPTDASAAKQGLLHQQDPPGMFLSRRGYRGEACAAGCAQSMITESGELAVTSAGCLRADMRLRLACRRDLLAVNCKSSGQR